MRTHYDILGVSRDADRGEIKRAWRVRLQLLHPDRHEGAPDDVRAEAARETALINDAWAILGDQARRRDYDRELSGHHSTTARRTAAEPARDPSGTGRPIFVCLRCRADLEISLDSTRSVCRQCFAPWRLVMCDGCGRNVLVDEHSTTWRCNSCNTKYPSHWGGTVDHECIECSWRNEVAKTSEEFVCAKCDLVYLRCSCGEYTARRSRRRKKWRCTHCDIDNTRVRA